MPTRTDTNPLGTLALRPQAQPTDQFAAPEVRRTTDGTGLMQLAGALSQIDPTVNKILDRQRQTDIEASQTQATADMQRLQLDNQQKLKEAVDAGKIAEQDNPWYMVQLKQDVARNEAFKAKSTIWNDYQNTPDVRFSDDPRAVQDFLNKKYAPLMQGADAWTVAAMAPIIEEGKTSILNEHVRVRQQEREIERQAASRDGVFNTLQGINKSVIDNADHGEGAAKIIADGQLQNATLTLNNLYNEMKKTMVGPKADQVITDAVVQYAKDNNDDRIAKRILGSIQAPNGKSLADSADGQNMLDSLSQHVYEENRRRVRDAYEDEKRTEEASFKTVAKVYLDRFNAARKTDPNADISSISLTPDELFNLAPEVQSRLVSLRTQMVNSNQAMKGLAEDDQTRKILQKLYGEGLRGAINKDAKISMFEALASLGKAGDAATYQGVEYHMQEAEKQAAKSETDPQTEIDLVRMAGNGQLTISHVIQAAEAGKLSQPDLKYWWPQAMANMAGSKIGMTDEHLDRMLTDMLSSKMMEGYDWVKNGGSPFPSREKFFQDPDSANQIAAARVAFAKARNDMLTAQPTMDFQEREQKTMGLLDAVSRKYGGYTYNEWQKKTEAKAAAPATKPLEAVTPKANIVETDFGDAGKFEPAVAAVDSNLLSFAKKLKITEPSLLPHIDGSETETYAPQTGFLNSPGRWVNGMDAATAIKDFRQERYRSTSLTNGLGPSSNPEDPAANAEELKLHQRALGRAQVLSQWVKDYNVVTRMKEIQDAATQRANQQGKTPFEVVTPAERSEYLTAISNIRELLYLRSEIGYTPQEAKQMGADAYLKVPVFANEYDLKNNGEKVATDVLGLNDPSKKLQFIQEQLRLLKGIYNNE